MTTSHWLVTSLFSTWPYGTRFLWSSILVSCSHRDAQIHSANFALFVRASQPLSVSRPNPNSFMQTRFFSLFFGYISIGREASPIRKRRNEITCFKRLNLLPDSIEIRRRNESEESKALTHHKQPTRRWIIIYCEDRLICLVSTGYQWSCLGDKKVQAG